MPSTQTPPIAGTAIDPTESAPADRRRRHRARRAGAAARAPRSAARPTATRCCSISARVDYLERAPRFDVVYHLLKLAPVATPHEHRHAGAHAHSLRRRRRPPHLPTVMRSVAVGRLGRARSLRSLRHRLRRAPGSAAHSNAVRLGRLSAAQGLSAARAGARARAASGFRQKSNVAAGTPPSGGRSKRCKSK